MPQAATQSSTLHTTTVAADGTISHNNISGPVVTMPLSNTSENLQKTVAEVADFKANNNGESPVQADMKRGDRIANGTVTVISTGISLLPMGKAAQYGTAFVGGLLGLSGTIERSPAYHSKHYGTVTK